MEQGIEAIANSARKRLASSLPEAKASSDSLETLKSSARKRVAEGKR